MNQTTNSIAQQARGRALLFGLPLEEAVNQSVSAQSENLTVLEAELLRHPTLNGTSGFGSLQQFLDDDSIEEFWINEPNVVRYANSDGNHEMQVNLSATELELYVDRMLRSTGRRIDRSIPFVDATLPDGSRLHAVIPTVTRQNWSVNVRKFRKQELSLQGLLNAKTITPEQFERLREAIARRESILVSGATQAGKTTLLTALLNELGPQERLVTIEDTFEINCRVGDWVAMQTRPAFSDGAQEISIRRLVRESLRMRPTRIAVGEVRGGEALDMLLAFNSGIPGFCTVHANSANHALSKISSLPLLASANIESGFISKLALESISLVAHCVRLPDGSRKVSQLLEVGA